MNRDTRKRVKFRHIAASFNTGNPCIKRVICNTGADVEAEILLITCVIDIVEYDTLMKKLSKKSELV